MTSPADAARADGEPVQHQRGRPRARKSSKHITEPQAQNLSDALAFADEIGLRLNVAIDIFWLMFFGSADDRTRLVRCQERLSKWCKRRDFPLAMIWVREIGRNGGPHVHILMHVPSWLMDNGEFQCALENSLEPDGGPSHEKAIMIKPAYAPDGKLRYNLKGILRRCAKQFHVRASPQGEIEGKRVGCTENIGPRARSKFVPRSRTGH
jgi:hypothetical protein